MLNKLNGKVAVVTGASKGLGAGIAQALAAEGAAVVVNYASSNASAGSVVEAITQTGGKAFPVAGDITKIGEAQGLVDAAIKIYGRLDIVVNNAGCYEFAALEDITEGSFHKHFNLNVLGLLLVTQAASRHLGTGGSIINIGSGVTRMKPPMVAVYAGTKGAVEAITGVLAKELAPRKIRVNSLNPGLVETEGTHAAGMIGAEMEKEFVAHTPLGRVGQPQDIAAVAVFLASDDSGWITGEVIVASGGL